MDESLGCPPWLRLNVGGPVFRDTLSYNDLRACSCGCAVGGFGTDDFLSVCGDVDAETALAEVSGSLARTTYKRGHRRQLD